MDLSTYDEAQLDVLAAAIAQRRATLETEKQIKLEGAKWTIDQSIDAITQLIGPDNPTAPGLNTLTEMQVYSNEEMAANTGLAHRLELESMEKVARAVESLLTFVSGKFNE